MENVSKAIIITDVQFFSLGSGAITRVKTLISYLSKFCHLTIVYLGSKPAWLLDDLFLSTTDLFFRPNENDLDKSSNILFVGQLLQSSAFSFCIIEYINLAYFLKVVPKHTISILDAHDIISERNESFNSFNYHKWDYLISREREFKIYRIFDVVMFVSSSDFESASKEIPEHNLILAPHPPKISRVEIRSRVKTIGYVASKYLPNIDALNWFLKHVWPDIRKEFDIDFNIYGSVCPRVPYGLISEGVHLKGMVEHLDSIYSTTDIMVNPVRIGSGLKIKNIETLGYGLPLITTSHGASGLKEGVGLAFEVADTVQEFKESLRNLILDEHKRRLLSENSLSWVSTAFSEEICFAGIKAFLATRDD